MMHCQHIAAYYMHKLAGPFASVREERMLAALHYDYTLASRDATFAALFFRY